MTKKGSQWNSMANPLNWTMVEFSVLTVFFNFFGIVVMFEGIPINFIHLSLNY